MRPTSGLSCLLILATLSSAAAQAPDLVADKSAYRLGDAPVFTVTPRADCLLTLVAIGADNRAVVLLPNRFQQDNTLRAAAAARIPGDRSRFAYRVSKCGDERVFAICRANNEPIGGIAHDFERDIATKPDLDAFLRWIDENKSDVTEITFAVDPPTF